MKRNNSFSLVSVAVLIVMLQTVAVRAQLTLKNTVGKHFLIGAAISDAALRDGDAAALRIAKQHFNCVVGENCMKGEKIHPEENRYDWTLADSLANFAKDNNMTLIGHCLVWHSQPPRWMFTDAAGKYVSRDTLISRMRRHIFDVVGRYRGRVKGWDVVNEAVNDDGSMRQSHYYNIIGPDYIELAFRFAHEADPNAELYINDYSMANPAKRATYCRLVREMKAKGLRIDAIGMQAHCGLDYPDLREFENSIDSFAALGVKVMITELDVNVLPNPKGFGGADVSSNYQYTEKLNPYRNGISKEGDKAFTLRYVDLFNIFYRHRQQISRVNLWGISDRTSWLNDYPVKGRTNYPLLFDRNYKAKKVVKRIVNSKFKNVAKPQ